MNVPFDTFAPPMLIAFKYVLGAKLQFRVFDSSVPKNVTQM